MKAILFACVFIYVFAFPVLSLDPNWRLLFSDEFSGDSVDTSVWNLRDEAGNYGNSELQYYLPQQVSVANGTLIITANNVSYQGYKYVSGWVDTQSNFYTTYGRYEFRAQMAGGKGMWPALWLLSEQYCWPKGAEFDIMEYRGSYPTVANGYYHYANCCACSESSSGGSYTAPSSLATSFHVYAVEWFPNNITWFIDDIPFHTFQQTQLASGYTQFDPSPHYIIINSAMGGGYAGTPDNTTVYPNYLYVDYVRVYEYRQSCTNACSGNGCCDSQSLLCVCNNGWAGSSCESWQGSFTDDFVSTNVQYTPATDIKVNGWSNGYTFFRDVNSAISNGLTLTITNQSCPTSCDGNNYSGAAWNSALRYPYGNFSFTAQASAVPGTGFSLQAAGSSSLMEQISFLITGVAPTQVQIITWHLDYQYVQATLPLGFDASAGFHTYAFSYNPAFILFFVDGRLIFNTSVVIPNVTLAMGAYYAAEPDWYGAPFLFAGPSTVKLSQATWQINPGVAQCSGTGATTTAAATTATTTTTTTAAATTAAATTTTTTSHATTAAATTTTTTSHATTAATTTTTTTSHATTAATTAATTSHATTAATTAATTSHATTAATTSHATTAATTSHATTAAATTTTSTTGSASVYYLFSNSLQNGWVVDTEGSGAKITNPATYSGHTGFSATLPTTSDNNFFYFYHDPVVTTKFSTLQFYAAGSTSGTINIFFNSYYAQTRSVTTSWQLYTITSSAPEEEEYVVIENYGDSTITLYLYDVSFS